MKVFDITLDELKYITDTFTGVSNKKHAGKWLQYHLTETEDKIEIIIGANELLGKVESCKDFNLPQRIMLIYWKTEKKIYSMDGHEVYMWMCEEMKRKGSHINAIKRDDPCGQSRAIIKLGQKVEVDKVYKGKIYTIDINSAYTAGHILEVENLAFRKIITEVYDKKKTAKDPQERQKYKDILNKFNGYCSKVSGLKYLYNTAIDTSSKILVNTWNNIRDNYGCFLLRIATDSLTFLDKEGMIEKLSKEEFNQLFNIGDKLGQYKVEGIYNSFRANSVNSCEMIKDDGTNNNKQGGVKKEGTVGKIINTQEIDEIRSGKYGDKCRVYKELKYKIKEGYNGTIKKN